MASISQGGKSQQTKMAPSQLRNEVHVESADDANPDHNAVPDDDDVVAETQYSLSRYNIEDSPRPSTGNRALSPTSHALLQRTTRQSRNEARDSPPIMFGLSRPKGLANVEPPSPPSNFFKPPSNLRKKTSKVVESFVQVTDSQAPAVSAPTTMSSNLTEATFQADVAVDDPQQDSRVQDQKEQPNDDQRQHHPPMSPPAAPQPHLKDSSSRSTPREVSPQVPANDAQPEYLEAVTASHVEVSHPPPRPKNHTGHNRQTSVKVKRVKRVKRVKSGIDQPFDHSRPPKNLRSRIRDADLIPKTAEQDVLAIVPESSNSVTHQDREGYTTKLSSTHPLIQETQDLRLIQQFHKPQQSEVSHVQETIENTRPCAVQEESAERPEFAFADQHQELALQSQAFPPTYRQPGAFSTPTELRRISQQSRVSHPRSGEEPPSGFDDVLHRLSPGGGPYRIVKSRGPKDGHSHIPSPLSGKFSRFSLYEPATLEYIKQIQLAAASSAHEMVAENDKLHAATILLLESTKKYQHEVIEGLRVEKSKLEGEASKLERKVRNVNNGTATMQKFVKGLEGDYNNLKQQVKAHHDNCVVALREKIAEVESEKTALLQDFSSTLETVATSRRKMKSVLDDCYTRLMVAESKKADLADRLIKQTALYEEEKQRRTELVQQTKPALQTILSNMERNYTGLCEKLSIIQSCVDGTSMGEEHDANLKRCIVDLQAPQATPVLTAESIQRVEDRIRNWHENVEGKLTILASSAQSVHPSTTRIEACILEVQALETKVINFNEAVAEHHQAQHTNELLRQQIEAQKDQSAKLEEEIRAGRQTESDLKTRYSQLEHKLKDLQDVCHDRESEPTQLDLELLSMRQQIRKAEEELQCKVTELSSANQHLQEQADEVAKVKRIEEAQKQKIMEQSREIHQSKNIKARIDTAELRKVEKRYEYTLQEKEIALNNNIHRITSERDEKNEALLTSEKELQATKARLQEYKDRARILEFDIKRFQETKSQAAETLQKTVPTPGNRDELSELRRQLLQKDAALQTAEEEANSLRQEMGEMKDKADASQKERDQQRALLAEREATIYSTRKQADSQAEQHEKNSVSLQELRDQVVSLQKAKADHDLSLEQSRSSERKLSDAQGGWSEERKSLRSQLDDARKTLDKKQRDFQRIQEERQEELDEVEENHKTEVNDLMLRLEQARTAKDNAEADAIRINAEKDRLIEEHKKITNQKFDALIEHEVQERLVQSKSLTMQSSRSQLQDSQDPSSISDALLNTQTGKTRKSVTRQNKSTLNNLRISQTQDTVHPISLVISNADLDDVDIVGAEEFGARERLNENGASIRDASPQLVSETQEYLIVSTEQLDNEINKMSSSSKCRSSSSLSDPPELLDMTESSIEASRFQTATQERSPLKDITLHSRNGELSSRGSNASRPERPERLESQAMTSFQIMAPPNLSVSSIENGECKHTEPSRATHDRSNGSSLTGNEAMRVTSSPDYMHHIGATSKMFGQRALPIQSHRTGTPQSYRGGGSHKRKSSEVHTESESSKRHQSSLYRRSSSISHKSQPDMPTVTHPSIPNRTDRSSRGPSHSGHNLRKSSTTGSAARPFQPSQRSSSSRSKKGPSQQDMKDRFNQELASQGRRRRR